ncbi:enoyl-CoA hydratase-related protein [Micromonospora sp. NPDC094482]|uniref:enoyl-CoA hydratase-related protein n=1 Tax=unclassified Micromonospora TaxID=2617518 RepID=UPI0033248309
MPTLTRRNDVFVLGLGDNENRFHPDWITSVNTALNEVEQSAGARALVTVAEGKFFSNGLDLDWLFANANKRREYLNSVHHLFARILSLPLITVAAVQGHAFAAGAMLSLAHDVRVMRVDRGFWCLPEVKLGLPFTPGMLALIQARLSPQTAHEAMTTARRYGGSEALAAAIVDRAVPESDVQDIATEIAACQASNAGDVLKSIKIGLYTMALERLQTMENLQG